MKLYQRILSLLAALLLCMAALTGCDGTGAGQSAYQGAGMEGSPLKLTGIRDKLERYAKNTEGADDSYRGVSASLTNDGYGLKLRVGSDAFVAPVLEILQTELSGKNIYRLEIDGNVNPAMLEGLSNIEFGWLGLDITTFDPSDYGSPGISLPDEFYDALSKVSRLCKLYDRTLDPLAVRAVPSLREMEITYGAPDQERLQTLSGTRVEKLTLWNDAIDACVRYTLPPNITSVGFVVDDTRIKESFHITPSEVVRGAAIQKLQRLGAVQTINGTPAGEASPLYGLDEKQAALVSPYLSYREAREYYRAYEARADKPKDLPESELRLGERIFLACEPFWDADSNPYSAYFNDKFGARFTERFEDCDTLIVLDSSSYSVGVYTDGGGAKATTLWIHVIDVKNGVAYEPIRGSTAHPPSSYTSGGNSRGATAAPDIESALAVVERLLTTGK